MKIREHNGIKYEVVKGWRSLIPGTNNLYRLLEPYEIKTPVTGYSALTYHLSLLESGLLCIVEGYEWDGPSGPTIDTRSFMRASLVHDAFYELVRKEQLPFFVKASGDMLLRRIALTDRMHPLRAAYAYRAVKSAADWAAMPTAPI